MSQKTLDIIKKHISDTLGVELISAHTDKDREAFNVNIVINGQEVYQKHRFKS